MHDEPEPKPADEASSVDDSGTIRQTLYKEPGSREQSPATEASQAELREINATTVVMDRSGSEHVSAERVTMNRSGARSLEAQSAQLDKSGVVALGADHAVLLQSSAMQVVAEEVRLSRSTALFVAADRATIENSRIAIFAGQADGDVHVAITARGAAIFGAATGLVLTFMLVLLGARSGRRD